MSIDKEFDYYLKHQSELVKQYSGKYLVIKNQKVEGVFDDELSAYQDASQKFDAGSFLIQPCLPGQEGYTQTFHSRVIF